MFRKTIYSTSDWRNDPFLLWHCLFWIKSNFQVTKKQQQQRQRKRLYSKKTFTPRVFHSVAVRTLTEQHRTTQTNKVTNRKASLEPATRDAQKLTQNVFPPWSCKLNKADQHWRRVVSTPSRDHFRNVLVKSSEMLGFWKLDLSTFLE